MKRAEGPSPAHLKGLDSLRFLAAMFVVVGHIPLNQESVGLPHPSWGAFFFRGATAVRFFFTLSGFLITYLLLREHQRTGTIDVRSFYFRRICRIWPLYFAVVTFGLFFYNVAVHWLGIPYRVEYNLGLALLLYVFFLPNLMNSLYPVGGILNPTWSIGIEEQFYLLWAPAVKRFTGKLPHLCCVTLGASLGLYCLNHGGLFTGWRENFVGQLNFHFLAAGALCAWWLHSKKEALLATPPFSSRVLQILLLAVLIEYYLLGFISWGWLGEELIQLVLYPWLILTVSVNPRNVVPVANRAFDYLGTISYGIYMLHMPAVYATSALFKTLPWWHGHPSPGRLALFCLGYYSLALATTFLLAHLSYRFFELPFLRLKERGTARPAADAAVVSGIG